MRVLITSGGTEERIDGVRSISNFSSGLTGATIADYFHQQGAEVISLCSHKSILPKSDVEKIMFSSFKDLDHSLQTILGNKQIDLVVHLAAVSDFSVDSIQIGENHYLPENLDKIGSTEEMSIKLKKNFKIIDRIKDYDSSKKAKLIGFKLTNNATTYQADKAISRVLQKGKVDYLVHNDLSAIDGQKHIATIYNKDRSIGVTNSKNELAKYLFEIGERVLQ